MTYVYRIVKWDETFESSQSRKVSQFHWVAVPNKQSGMGFTRIISQADGASIYGIWCMILGACSQQKSPRNGWLTCDGTASGVPWTIEDLAEKWRRTPAEIARALDVICSPKVAWIEALEIASPARVEASVCDSLGARSQTAPSALPVRSQTDPTTGQDSTGQDKTGREDTHARVGTPAPPPIAHGSVGRQEANVLELRKHLARKRFACDDTALEEWRGLLNDEARCSCLQEAFDLLHWLKVEGRRRGINSRYASAYEGMAIEWRRTQASTIAPQNAQEQEITI